MTYTPRPVETRGVAREGLAWKPDQQRATQCISAESRISAARRRRVVLLMGRAGVIASLVVLDDGLETEHNDHDHRTARVNRA